jgi:hypothetical protein
MNLRIIAHASEPGGGANEDGAGNAGRFAWIIDGASGVSARTLDEGATDAAWLAGTIDAALRERIGRGAPDLDALLHGLEGDLERRFAAALRGPLASESDGPSACLALAEFQPLGSSVRVRAAVIADVCVFVPGADGLERWTDERVKPFEAETLDMLNRSERVPLGIPEAVLAQIRRNRAFVNRAGGYYVVHPRLPWAHAVRRFEAVIRPGAPVVLATDGFLRLCDLFGHRDPAGLVAAVGNGETAALLAELRRLEREDPEGRLHLRVKTHDDATVLAVAADLPGR